MGKIKKTIFYLQFQKNYYNKGDILTTGNNVKIKILETPHKKWWKQLLQFITFRLYKSPTQYKCKVIE
jgi:hypothetical protein